MPSMSPSPVKRPSMAERSSSTHSLSSQGKQPTTQQRVHRVSRHSRNMSHGKALNKLGKVNTSTNVTADGRNHARKKSGQITPGPSPKSTTSPNMKRNSSQANLPKNTSQANLRKNHSARELAAARNVSLGNLKKLGAPPSQKAKEEKQKEGFFQLGDQSSGEEDDEGEWEDSTATHSPELSRNHSKASTPLRSQTPNGDADQRHTNSEQQSMLKKVVSPTAPHPSNGSRSVPNLRDSQTYSTGPNTSDPALLQNQPRATRAPPAMSTVSAHVKRSDSTRSFTKISRQVTSGPSGQSGVSGTGTASSGSQGVSHFLPSSSVTTSGGKSLEDESDGETDFMSNYRPQASESPEKSRMLNKSHVSNVPSRTLQKLELQRRETMRASAAASTTPSTPGLGLSVGSSVSLHSRSGSRGRNRSIVGDPKALRHDYEAGIKHLMVVRRFRNPIIESLHRLQESQIIPSETSSTLTSSSGAAGASGSGTKSRPQSRRGLATTSNAPDTPRTTTTTGHSSPEDKKGALPQHSRASSRSRTPKVQFQMSRQGSHEDILTTTSQGSPGEFDDETDGITPEEALIRRMWESRVIFESDGVQSSS